MPFDARNRGHFRSKSIEGNKYPEKNGNYSPSARYFYGGASQPPQHQHQGGGGGGGGGGNQHHRREHRRDGHGGGGGGGGGGQWDRLAKQNDVIIRLLKEIRDRLPPPPVRAVTDEERQQAQTQALEDQQQFTAMSDDDGDFDAPQGQAVADDPVSDDEQQDIHDEEQ